ncbi:hypothetical protein T12_7599 [Trichinella patagoniensis]|uniref:Uncharacterized protein n=1 Tax=Trichinella patagoniensis TaxID=990121 RepID=A0A0V1A1T7_9BILA|nr:hypothetical protein T12_7599 [Trichinella patagoniensis]
MPPTINDNSPSRAANYGRSNAQGESIDVGAHSTVIFCRLSMTILPCYVGRVIHTLIYTRA